MRATDTPDGDRRPDLQHLSFQFRDIPRRHPVDPRRPVERRARPWHVQQPDDGAHYPSAGDHARAAVSGIDSGLAGQGHLAGRDHLGAETVLRVAEARAESYRILEVLTAVTVIYWLLGYPRQTRRLDSSTLEGCGMTTSDPILPARDVRNSYGKLVALDGVSVSVGAARWSV